MSESVRLDKWLWAVRLFKTRTLAAEAVRLGRVTMKGQPLKPSRVLKLGDTLHVQQPDLLRTIRVKALREHRMGAALVPEFMEDLTSPEDIARAAEIRKERRLAAPAFEPGVGRPTKHQRREMDGFLAQVAATALDDASADDLDDSDEDDGVDHDDDAADPSTTSAS